MAGRPHRKAVIVRLGSVGAERMFGRLKDVRSVVAQALSDGAILVIEDDGVRIRPLPLERV